MNYLVPILVMILSLMNQIQIYSKVQILHY